jgi:hypothetical protein
MSAPTLRTTQQLLWALIHAPEGAAAGLTALPAETRGVAAGLVRNGGALTAVERIDIYANMYFFRIRDCLEDDFPAVLAVIGGAHFHNLITDYLLHHPPSHFSLRYAGRHLAPFLTHHPLSKQWPYLGDLASFEWAIVEAFDAADTVPLDAQALVRIPQDEWPALHFSLVPPARLLTLGWPVHEVWQRRASHDEGVGVAAHATHVRVWRQDLRVFHRVIDPVEMSALGAIVAGASFGEVCALVAEAVGEQTGTERALTLLSDWVADGFLTMRE